MLDIRKIKENPDAVKAGLKAKEVDCDAIIDKILDLDVKVRGLKTSTETKTAEKNKIAKENGSSSARRRAPKEKVRTFPPSRLRSPPTWPAPSRSTRRSPATRLC